MGARVSLRSSRAVVLWLMTSLALAAIPIIVKTVVFVTKDELSAENVLGGAVLPYFVLAISLPGLAARLKTTEHDPDALNVDLTSLFLLALVGGVGAGTIEGEDKFRFALAETSGVFWAVLALVAAVNSLRVEFVALRQ